VDVAAIHVDAEADAHTHDLVEVRPPRRDVEERGDELAPRREPRPVEIRDAEVAIALGHREIRDERERAVGPREVGGVDDEPVCESEEVVEALRGPGPPEEHREVGDEERDDDARDALVGVAAHAGEDLLVADLRGLVRTRHMAMQLDRDVDALTPAIAEDHDAARRVSVRELRRARRGAARVLLTVGEDDEVEDGRAGDAATLLARVRGRLAPEARELALERADGRDLRSPDGLVDVRYGRRQTLPSRSMSVSPSGGPQEPAG
jgi:hypothetical protein